MPVALILFLLFVVKSSLDALLRQRNTTSFSRGGGGMVSLHPHPQMTQDDLNLNNPNGAWTKFFAFDKKLTCANGKITDFLRVNGVAETITNLYFFSTVRL